MEPGIDAEQHAWRMGRFGEQAVNVVAEGQLQAKCHAAGAAADLPLKLKDGTRVLYAIGEAAVKDGELHLGAQSFAVLG